MIAKGWFHWCGLAALLMYLAMPVAYAEAGWLRYDGPRYTLYSQLTEARTDAWIRQYDQFIAIVSRELGVDPQNLAPLSIVVFEDDVRFNPYKPLRPDGTRPDSLRGFFARREGWNVVGVAADRDNSMIDPVVLHEGVHWMLSVDGRSYPAWFSEGAAELFSTFKVRRAKASWGNPQPGLARVLRSTDAPDIESLLAADRSDPMFDAAGSTGVFYARSWALTHYLVQHFGAKETFARLRDWMDHGGAADPATVLTAAFGLDPAKVEVEVAKYTRAALFEKGRALAGPAPGRGRIALPRASKASVEAALGRLALGARLTALAAEHADAAMRADPASPEGHELRTLIAQQRQAAPDVLASAAADAIAAGSRDPLMAVLLADGLEAAAEADIPLVARRRAALYQRAIDLRPTLRVAHERLPLALRDVTTIEEADVAYLKLGRDLYPSSGMPLVGLAIVEQRRGSTQAALAQLESALQPARRLNAEQAEAVRSLLTAWRAPVPRQRVEGVPTGGGGG
jgi:hypothetical protein